MEDLGRVYFQPKLAEGNSKKEAETVGRRAPQLSLSCPQVSSPLRSKRTCGHLVGVP
jgi:hypothetical protein